MQAGQPQGAGQPGPAKVRYGVYDQQIPTGTGINVGQLRTNYQTVWSMPGDVEAYVGGQRVDDSYVLAAGQQLEFHRKAGEKG